MLNNYLSTRMHRSFTIKSKLILIISTAILFLVSTFYGCQKTEYDNPHDSSVMTSLWAPQNLTAVQTSLKTASLKWTQTDQRIDSFRIESRKGNAEWKTIGYTNKSTTTFIDNTFIPDPASPVDYRIVALAWTNRGYSGNQTITPLFVRPNFPNAQKAPGVKVKVSWVNTYVNEDGF